MTTTVLQPYPTLLHVDAPPQKNPCDLCHHDTPAADLKTISDDLACPDCTRAFEAWNDMRHTEALARTGELTPRPTAGRAA